MKFELKKNIRFFFLLLLALSLSLQADAIAKNRDVLYQNSIINALLEGVYEGDVTFKEVKRRGNFGIGTFNELDGEMIAFDGEFFQIRADGVAYPVKSSMKTPFVSVTFFESDEAFELKDVESYDALKRDVDAGAVNVESLSQRLIQSRDSVSRCENEVRMAEALISRFEDNRGEMSGELTEIRGRIETLAARLEEIRKGAEKRSVGITAKEEERAGLQVMIRAPGVRLGQKRGRRSDSLARGRKGQQHAQREHPESRPAHNAHRGGAARPQRVEAGGPRGHDTDPRQRGHVEPGERSGREETPRRRAPRPHPGRDQQGGAERARRLAEQQVPPVRQQRDEQEGAVTQRHVEKASAPGEDHQRSNREQTREQEV